MDDCQKLACWCLYAGAYTLQCTDSPEQWGFGAVCDELPVFNSTGGNVLLAPEDRLVGLSNQNSRLDHLFLKEHDNCFTCPPFGVSVNVLQSDLKYTHVDLPF